MGFAVARWDPAVAFVSREQQIRLMGYDPSGQRARRWGFGAPADAPFDLNDPENVLELKRALWALAKLGADPLQNPDPIRENRWQQMALTGDFAASWDGASADEFVAAISRHARLAGIDGPYMQIGGSKFGIGIVGGPQPTAAGLEVIAGALQARLGGQPAMSRYLAWRGGVFEPPSTISMPGPGSIVTPTSRFGKLWDPLGYTPVWPEGARQWVDTAAQIDASLVGCWQQLEAMQTSNEEARRQAIEECILSRRVAHHEAALIANQGAPDPECPWPMIYDRAQARCYKPAGVIDLPMIELTDERCVQAYMEIEGKTEDEAKRLCGVSTSRAGLGTVGAVIAGVGLGAALWWWQRRRNK